MARHSDEQPEQPRTLGPGEIVRRVSPYLWPRGETEIQVRVVLAMLLLLSAKIATVVTPFFFKAAVDALGQGGIQGGIQAGIQGGVQGGLEAGAGQGAADGDLAGALLTWAPLALVLGYGFARLSSVLFQQLRDVAFAKVGQQALRRLAIRAFVHIHALSLRYHLERRTGALSRIVERGVKAIEFVLRFLLFSIFPLLLELAMVAAILFWLFDVRFLLVVLVTIAAYIAFTFAITEWRVKIRRIMNDRDQEAHQRAVDSLLNYETVKYFAAEARETERYDGAMQAYEQAAIKTQLTLALLNGGQALIITAGLIALMAMAAEGVVAGTMTVGDFVMVNAYMIQIMLPLNFLGTVYRELRQALIDMTEMFGLMERPAEIRDKPGAPALRVSAGRVSFERVDFAYNPDRQILRDVSFDLAGGQTLALVGATGSGKSTIARLLFRFYDVTGGAVRIDGQDLRDVRQTSLRAQIGVVPQDTVLFNDTIGYNIAYASPEATMAEVRRAAEAARIDAFIASLPQGYDTLVGERGLKLSGGEKQRVAIARTILKNPPILVLDEATSALDTGTEREIQASLRALGRDRTVIAIAHRLSTVVDADQILVLDAGAVVERGTHAALLAEDGRYAQMWRRQATDQDEAAGALA
ncbi:MAG: ABC transporter ATP-binding protein/permease [Pseudomonadota bacterium]